MNTRKYFFASVSSVIWTHDPYLESWANISWINYRPANTLMSILDWQVWVGQNQWTATR